MIGTLLVLSAGLPASAHDVLLQTTPSDGSRVQQPPDVVVLTFEEPPVSVGALVSVVGPTGERAAGAPDVVGSTVRQRLRAGSPAGPYLVRWRVTSDDGHPVSGQFSFTAMAAASTQTGTATPTGGSPSSGGTSSPSSSGQTATVSTGPQPSRTRDAPPSNDAGHRGLLAVLGAGVLLAVLAVALVIVMQSRRGGARTPADASPKH